MTTRPAGTAGERPSPGVIALTVALVVGACAAFVQTQVLKAQEPPARASGFAERLAPGCGCDEAVARLSVELSRTQVLDATIVDDDDDPVRTLATDSLRGAGDTTFTWTGRNDAGELVPDGDYRLHLALTDPDRSIVLPRAIQVKRR